MVISNIEMTRNFGAEFLEEISKFGQNTALIWKESTITYDHFSILIKKWASKLDVFQKRSNEPLRVALFCTNCPDIIAIVVAAQLIGITVVPLNPSYRKYEISEYLLKSGANFIIATDDVEFDKFDDVKVHTTQDILSIEEDSQFSKKNTGTIVFFSSGTTGPPKKFEFPQTKLCAQLDQLRAARTSSLLFSPSESDVCYGVLPFFHAGGLVTVVSMLFSGCSLLVNERWNEREFLENCQKYRVTVLFLVPPVLHFLANHEIVLDFDLSSLKTIYVGAAASFPEDFEKVAKRFEGLHNLIQLYGTTECGVLLCSTGTGISDGTTVGRPFPFVEIHVDSENCQIMVKSPTGIEDGFMETGDLGSFENGELRIIGRSKEMIKVRGWQVNPIEIETVVRFVEGVRDCAVYQDQSTGKLIAKIVGNPEKQTVIETVKENLASYKHVDDVILVDELPRNPSGKLVRHLLQ